MDWRVEKLDWIGLEDWRSGRVENKQMDIARNRLGESGRLWNLGRFGKFRKLGKLDRLWKSKGLESLECWESWDDFGGLECWKAWKCEKDSGV